MMITLTRTNSAHPDFQMLVRELDKDLAIRNGEANDFFAQYNKIDLINHVVLAYSENTPVGCGAMKAYDAVTMEIKRMFVPAEMRGKGIAVAVLTELENWSRELGYQKCILETGKQMPEAIALYKKCGYHIIPNYGQYVNVESSVCFEKRVDKV
jgi:GNAT superfamily N-acetyltransferase